MTGRVTFGGTGSEWLTECTGGGEDTTDKARSEVSGACGGDPVAGPVVPVVVPLPPAPPEVLPPLPGDPPE